MMVLMMAGQAAVVLEVVVLEVVVLAEVALAEVALAEVVEVEVGLAVVVLVVVMEAAGQVVVALEEAHLEAAEDGQEAALAEVMEVVVGQEAVEEAHLEGEVEVEAGLAVVVLAAEEVMEAEAGQVVEVLVVEEVVLVEEVDHLEEAAGQEAEVVLEEVMEAAVGQEVHLAEARLDGAAADGLTVLVEEEMILEEAEKAQDVDMDQGMETIMITVTMTNQAMENGQMTEDIMDDGVDMDDMGNMEDAKTVTSSMYHPSSAQKTTRSGNWSMRIERHHDWQSFSKSMMTSSPC